MEKKPLTLDRIRRLIEEEGASLLAGNRVEPNKIAVAGSTDGQALINDNGITAWGTISGTGVSDHGALTGLADDDHTQYHNDARGDARYWQLSTDLATQAELDAHLNDTTDAHDASAISIVDAAGDFTATDVEGALAELQSDHETDAQNLTDHINDAVAAHAGTAISNTPAGNIVATTVQAAIDELDSEKATTGSVTTVQTNLDAETAARALADVLLDQDVDDLRDEFEGHHHDERYYSRAAVDALLGSYLTTATAASTYQPLDSDLTTIAGLTATTDNIIQSVGSAWASRTPAQVAATIPAASISGFDTQVRTSRMSGLTLPNAAVPMNSQKFTGLAAGTLAGDSLRYEQLFTTGNVSLLGGLRLDGGADYIQVGDLGVVASILQDDSLAIYTVGAGATMELTASSIAFGVSASTDVSISRTAANTLALGSGDKLQQNAAPTVGDDLTNKTYADGLITTHAADTSSAHTAQGIDIVDAGAYFTGTEVEAALQEVGADIAALSAGSGIPGSTIDAKGDLIVGTADDTYSRRAVPDNKYSIVADSTTTTGWRNELFATQQEVDDLRDEFEGHYHPAHYPSLAAPSEFYLARSLGSNIRGMTMNPSQVAASITLNDGTAYLYGFVLPEPCVLTGVWWIPSNTGAFTADNSNKVGLYTRTRGVLTKVAESTNDAATFKTAANSFSQKAFSTTYSAAAGFYYVALLRNESLAGTTTTILGVTAASGAAMQLDLGVGLGMSAYATATQTDLAATYSSATSSNSGMALCGVY